MPNSHAPQGGNSDIQNWFKKHNLPSSESHDNSSKSQQSLENAGYALDENATERQSADLLKAKLPEIRCVGDDWYSYEGGYWRKGSRNSYRPAALSIQHSATRTSRKAACILDHIEDEKQSSHSIFRSFNRFDSNSILINCANGVLRVDPGGVILLSHSAEHFFSGQLSASYNEEATAPNFERVLQEALSDSADIDLFRLYAGYTLFPDCRYQCALICSGPSGTGKSTLTEAIENVLGPDLVRHLSLVQICDPQSKILAQLQHLALNVSTELNAIEVGSEIFKQLVCGEPIQADRKFKSDISLRFNGKLLFSANHLPKFKHGTDAETRRIRILPFYNKPVAIEPALRGPDSLIALERDGVFRFMIDGLRDLMTRNEMPEGGHESKRLKSQFKVQNDSIGTFVETKCILGPKRIVEKDGLYRAYQEFCECAGIPAAELRYFCKELQNRFAVRPTRPRDDGTQRIQKFAGIDLRT
jgi:putative DNA primase/helicase